MITDNDFNIYIEGRYFTDDLSKDFENAPKVSGFVYPNSIYIEITPKGFKSYGLESADLRTVEFFIYFNS